MIKTLASVLLLLFGCTCAPVQIVHQVPPFPPTEDADARYIQRLETQTVQLWHEHVYVGKDRKLHEVAATGTGVVLSVNDGKTLILTAGHVAKTMEVVPDLDDPTGKKMYPTIFSVMHVYDLNNYQCMSRVLEISDKPDLALVEANCVAGTPVELADGMPPIGGRIVDVSEVASYHPNMSFCVTDGRWLGVDEDGDLTVSAAAAGGASGSGIFYRGKLVGILVSVNAGFEHLAHGVPIGPAKEFIAKAVAKLHAE
jgi:hypothetical protein